MGSPRTRRSIVEGLKAGEIPLRPVNVKVFVCTNHDGYHAPSSHRASVIVAKDIVHARELLDEALIKCKLRPFKRYRYDLSEVSLNHWSADILANGSL